MAKSNSHLRVIATTSAKAAVSIGLIAFALRGVDFTTVLIQLRNVELHVLVLAVIITTAISFLHARRWEVVLARMDHALPFSETVRLVLIGYFFNQTLPSTIGGDAYRAWGAYKRGIHAGKAIASVVVDRVFALVALVVMIAAGARWLFDVVPTPMARWAVATVCVGGALGLVVLLALPRYAEFLRRWRTSRYLLHVSEGTRAVMASGRAVTEVLVLTVAGYAVLSYVVYLLAQGLGASVSMANALLFVPLVTLVTVLPVSIAGWGLRESAMVVALGFIGVPALQAFSISVLLGLAIMGSGLPGGVLWLLARRKSPPSDSRPQAQGMR